MKIALISLHTSPTETPGQRDAGGMNVVIDRQARALSNMGHDVTVFTRASKNIWEGIHHLNDSPVRVVALKAGFMSLLKENLPATVTEFARKLQDFMRQEERPFDLIHAHYWLSGLALTHLEQNLEQTPRQNSQQNPDQRQVPKVVTFHTVAAQKNQHLAGGDTAESDLRFETEGRLFQTFPTVAMSNSELQALTGAYSAGRAVVITPGVDTELFRPQNRTLWNESITTQQQTFKTAAAKTNAAKASPPKKITVLGRVQPLKGQQLAIEAFVALQKTLTRLKISDPPLELVIAGEPTPGSEKYYSKLKKLAAKAPVTFLPAQSRQAAAELLASSDLVLIPSHSETFGLVALEAAACGTPVIASKVAGLQESVKDGHSGYLIAGRDPAIWAAKIARVIGDEKEAARLSANAIEWAAENSWQTHANKLTRFYTELIQSAADPLQT